MLATLNSRHRTVANTLAFGREMSTNLMTALPPSSIPIFTAVNSYREWRRKAYDEKKSVGFVATMGALHDGHVSLVRRSLVENDLTVVSIFVNPAQFAPHEDLTTYPRTLAHDLEVLESLKHAVEDSPNVSRSPSALFLPSVYDMYPSGITQDKAAQQGTFVEVKGYSHQMEGSRRPDFFRGVATVVTKLFNVIEPSRTYFGQKDIQQALLLRRMTRDLLLSHPTPESLFIVPTARDSKSNIALSSRNAYLTPAEYNHAAPTLYAALQAAKSSWGSGSTKSQAVTAAHGLVERKVQELLSAQSEIALKLDYIEMNDPDSFEIISDNVTAASWDMPGGAKPCRNRPVILSGAMWVGKTRLIDNIILGDASQLGILS
ncbi:hypothetical protein QCA50_010405 [Cerrena zonata]|uniref:Pantoate--beta-alanine ligase n=1 Tax=Cerrena zonata TaxID=2478898 RepID=A0AAW0GAT9_9APHY